MELAMDHDTRTDDDGSSFGSEVDTDVEDAAEAGLKTRKPRHQFSGAAETVLRQAKAVTGDGEPSKNTAYLEQNGGAIEDLNIQKLLTSVQYDANSNGVTKPAINAGGEVIKPKSDQIEDEITEEEVVELEFENAIPKLQTHTMHCPNCDHHITKVVLRRKTIKRRTPIAEERHKPVDLLGCFSCFSLFTSTGNGGFNPFPIFGKKPTSGAVPQADGNDVVGENGNCFSIFRIFRKDKDFKQPKDEEVDKDSEQPKKNDRDFEESKPEKFDHTDPPVTQFNNILNKLPIRQGDNYGPKIEGIPSKPENEMPEKFEQPSPYITGINDVLNKLPIRQGGSYEPNVEGGPSSKPHEKHESSIDVPPDTSFSNQVPLLGSSRQEFTSFEILKSIVYGGLMEIIASLSIIASAAAGGATTLNIIALALANLIGGIFVIGHNLWDLKDDCYKYTTEETTTQESRNKYKELLGSVEHFPLHAFFAILSFLVFGIIPPVTYGYAFHETNDNDFTMLIVAVASFVCVGLLAIFKAYIDRCNGFAGYVKTILYYLTTAVAVSGASYVAGNLVKRLIEELGLFDASSNLGMAVVSDVVSTNPSLAYY